MARLTFAKVKKYFNESLIIKSLDIEVMDGEMLVIVGPSGCGKSTLLRMVAGLEDISAGSISIDDKVINHLEPMKRNIAMVFQNYALYPHMSVFKNLAYGLKRRKLSKEEIQLRIMKASELLGIEKLLDRKPKELSGGQRQRVAMGRAIVRKPALFLFDEPLSNLDSNLRSQMRVEIRKLQKQLKTTTLYVTHDQVEAMTMADRIIVLNEGVVEQFDTPDNIYHKPASVFVGGFMGAPPMNFLKAYMNDSADCILLGEGALLPLGRKLEGSYANKEIILGIRPESILKANNEGADVFKLQVNMIEYLGAEKLVYGHFLGDEQTLTVRIPNKVPAAKGELLILGVMPDSLHVFDKQTKKRL